MGDILSLVIALIILVIFSGYFSATETAFSTVNKIRLKSWFNKGNKSAGRALNLASDFDRLITNILIGNNIVNILATTLATILFTEIIVDNPSLAATLTTVVMTLVVLTFGEIFPKVLAKRFPEQFAMFSAPIIKFLGYVFYPLSFVYLLLQKIGSKIFKPKKDTVTDEELITIIDEAESEGFDKENSELIRSAVEFNDVTVDKILTPRVDVVAIEKGFSFEQIFATFKKSGFSRLPVYVDTIDNIIGFIHEKNFFFAMHDKKTNIDDIIQRIHFSQPQVTVDEMLKKMQLSKTHMAVVLDEFGGTMGIVTLEDCLEQLVGEIYDETDEIEESWKSLGDKTYLVNGNAELSETFEHFKKKVPEAESTTIGGWVCEYLGYLPKKDFTFEYEKMVFTVVEISKHRIKNLKIVLK